MIRGWVIASSMMLAGVLVSAQELVPRRWSQLPTGMNYAGAAYAYTAADVLFDPVLQLEDVEMDLQTFEILDRSDFALQDSAHARRATFISDDPFVLRDRQDIETPAARVHAMSAPFAWTCLVGERTPWDGASMAASRPTTCWCYGRWASRVTGDVPS